ncbi:unnamed protein product [marine sediment metagenome]|uniref:Uncharacterized protein n=1 Tax=marine sediment metagenome TaxID=412755 RepID=X0YWL3_9ZZZZ
MVIGTSALWEMQRQQSAEQCQYQQAQAAQAQAAHGLGGLAGFQRPLWAFERESGNIEYRLRDEMYRLPKKPKQKHKKKTYRQELQDETDEWLKDIF